MTRKRPSARTSWEPVADWYDGWVGKRGSHYHRKLAIPTTLELLALQPGERLLDLGAGQGVFASYVGEAGAAYVGLEASPKFVELARKHHGKKGKFLQGDVRRLQEHPKLQGERFDAAVFLLSIQDMDPLEEVLTAAGWAMKPGGRLVIFMTHPCFRVPRQSGWGWDEGRKLVYRRVDRYLTPLPVPMKAYGPGGESTRSFHRPLQDYMRALSGAGFSLEDLRELADTVDKPQKRQAGAGEPPENREIPLFLALRARKAG